METKTSLDHRKEGFDHTLNNNEEIVKEEKELSNSGYLKTRSVSEDILTANSLPVVSVTDTGSVNDEKFTTKQHSFTKGTSFNGERELFTVKAVGKRSLDPLPTLESLLEKADRKSWGYKSVLFWKQDSLSIASSSDTEDVRSVVDFKDDMQNEELTKTPACNQQVNELVKDIDALQKKCVDPLLPTEEGANDHDSDTSSANSDGSPVYLDEIPVNSVERYSPIYKGISECLDKILEIYNSDINVVDISDNTQVTSGINEEDTIKPSDLIDVSNSLHSEGDLRSPCLFGTQHVEDSEQGTDVDLFTAKTTLLTAFINSKEQELQRKVSDENTSVNFDVISSIRKVEQTLLEISQELENVKGNKASSSKKDPNIVLSNLLSQIRPPRDSLSSYPRLRKFGELGRIDSEDTPTEGPDRESMIIACEEVKDIEAYPLASVISEPAITTGDRCKYYHDDYRNKPDVFTEELKPVSLLHRVYENLREIDKSVNEKTYLADSPTGSFAAVKSPVPTLSVSSHPEIDYSPQSSPSYERRGSAWSTNTAVMNYDSGFSEFPRSSVDNTERTNIAKCLDAEQGSPKRVFSPTEEEGESETSTDWSPNSTLSREQSKKHKVHPRSVRPRSTPKRRSNPANINAKSSSLMAPTSSCPNFSHSLAPGSKSAVMYSRTELDAIRKFLALTSQYFGKKSDEEDDRSESFLHDSENIEIIRNTIDKQRQDLDKQRSQQEELLRQMGEMLLEIVTLKEEHVSVRQRQAKALTILKKQLDHHRKEQERAQKDLKDQVRQLGDKLDSQLSILQERPRSECTNSCFDRLSLSTSQDGHSKGEIVWKITNVSKKIAKIHAGHSDGVVVSEHFYSHPYGYKMATWLYLNGRGEFRGKGMSIYVCVLVGEYDAILSWPIRPRYRFALVDQNPVTEKRRDHVKVRRVADIANRGENAIAKCGGIPKPHPGSKSLIVGFDDFISQRELSQRHYIVDDTIFFKVCADSF